MEEGKAKAAELLGVDVEDLSEVDLSTVTATGEEVEMNLYTVTLTSDAFVAGTTYAVHMGDEYTYAYVYVAECTEDGVLTFGEDNETWGYALAGIYYVASTTSSSTADGTSTTTDASSLNTGDTSVWFYVVLLAGAAAAVAVIAKKRVNE